MANTLFQLNSFIRWTIAGRVLVFVLAAASIWCLLLEMYGVCGMRAFAFYVLLPSTLALYGIAWLDWQGGSGRLTRNIMVGTVAGLVGALAYDAFRLPFVFSESWGLDSVVPQMPLFKVFPRFGALLLGEASEQPSYSLLAHLLGWAYHFSNGATIGVMFAMIVGDHISFRRAMIGGVAMAVAIELLMLVSPYTRFFDIHLSARFVTVTMTAHVIFGLFLGAYFAWKTGRLRAAA